MTKRIAIVWKAENVTGRILLSNKAVIQGCLVKGNGLFSTVDGTFAFQGEGRLELTIEEEVHGENPILVSVDTSVQPFSFFLKDVDALYPIFIPAYQVAVTSQDDDRSYEQIATAIKQRGLITNLQKISFEPEESFEEAAKHTQELSAQTWLGLSRDIRIFEVGFRSVGEEESHWDWVQPRLHGKLATLPETDGEPVRYRYLIGRGIGCTLELSRRLEEGILPILHTDIVEEDILYHITSFVSYAHIELIEQIHKGTHYLVADGYGIGNMLSKEQEDIRARLMAEVSDSEDETVLYSRIEATNRGRVPRYAWFRNIEPNCNYMNNHKRNYTFDKQTGFVKFAADRVCCVSKLNGKPLAHEETAILIKPGETAVFEFYIPHSPISEQQAFGLMKQDFAVRQQACSAFWKSKLANAAQIKLPEKRVEEMLQAGLLHLDLISYGVEPESTVVPTIGIYTAIGSESSPIIQYMDSMGWYELAQRALTFFLEKQHEDGLIQNFGGYMLETGATLWTIGEHYRYTRDAAWVEQIKPQLIKAFDYIAAWRQRNLRENLIGKGYGMLDGKTADPEDPFHSFMLNGYAYLGLSRLAEMLDVIDQDLSGRVQTMASELKADILNAFHQAMASSPVVPLGDGSWVPTAPPWVGYPGPVSLFASGGKSLTHGSFVVRDSLLGPLYLVFQELIDPRDPAADFMLSYHNELMCIRNVALSQPYYSMHPWVHLQRSEVKPFLKAYYNSFSALADRGTYTFWEHHFRLSPHKTHEEAWFLMQTRWMLYMEKGDSLCLLSGIPRKWLESGERIELQNVATYFGSVSLCVVSELDKGIISARVSCDSLDRKLYSVKVRIPHPQERLPLRVFGGIYNVESESVEITAFSGSADIQLHF